MQTLFGLLLLIGITLVCGLKDQPLEGEVDYKLKYDNLKQFGKSIPYKKLSMEPRVEENFNENIKYFIYTRNNADKPETIEPDVESVIRNTFNPLKPTTISIHRFQGDKDSPENQVIVSTKLEQEDCNVIVVDWSSLAGGEYADAVAAAPIVGDAIAEFIILLHKHFAVKYEQFHLVGFSLGAHVAGFAGQSVFSKTLDDKVLRITGLDPAGEIFNDIANKDGRLSADDAQFVDVIHTNGGGLGYQAACGHADYYPNGGENQPGCSADDRLCSHTRAYEIVKEMWSRQNDFVATKCTTTAAMSLDHCMWVNVKMGETLLKTGLYYLETNEAYPYSKGSFVYEFL